MGMKKFFSSTVLYLASIACLPAQATTPVAMERLPWPQPHDCATCIALQFGALSMHLPSALVGGIFVSASALAQLHIIPAGAGIRTGLFFHALPSAQIAGKYQSLVQLPPEPEIFFDRLGEPAPAPGPWSKIRTVEQLDTALRYTKMSKDTTHVYWVRGSLTNSHRLYVVIDGSPVVYAVAGELTPEFVDAMLANLVITPEP